MSSTLRPTSRTMPTVAAHQSIVRPLYLMVGFWGDRFRNFFLDFCLPSLLSPNNLGVLAAADGHRLLICTTVDDWAKLTQTPLWSTVQRHVSPTFIEAGLPEDSSAEAKFRHMTAGHRLLVNAALKDRALACQIMPDAMYTDGTIACALRYASQGAYAVLTVAMRLKEEGLFADLLRGGVISTNSNEGRTAHAITLRSRSVIDIAIANLYDDCLQHDWHGSRFPSWPAFCFWRIPDQSGILIHSAYFAYILLDLSRIQQHNERSFDIACIENYWLSDNFPDPSLIRIVQDSDEAMVVSWTPSAPYPPPPPVPFLFRSFHLSALWKGYRLRCMREFHVSIGDPQKATNIRFPIRWHTHDINADWLPVQTLSSRVMLWFFGDVFPEFAANTRLPTRFALRAWWWILRLCVALRPQALAWRRIWNSGLEHVIVGVRAAMGQKKDLYLVRRRLSSLFGWRSK